MRFDDDIYGYNPYGLRPEKAEGGTMNIMRSTLMVCVTIIISVAMTLLFMYSEERFNIIKGKEGIFVFDKKTTALNYCDDEHCVLISNKFHHHHHKKMSSKFSLIPQKNMSMAMPQQQMMAMPQQQMVAIPMYAQPVMPQAFVTKAAKAAKKSNDENSAPSEDATAPEATDDGSAADATASDNSANADENADESTEKSPAQKKQADNNDDTGSDDAPAADTDNNAGSDTAG